MEQKLARSVRDETKAKFDALLRAAMTKSDKNKNNNNQKLIDDDPVNISESSEEETLRTDSKEDPKSVPQAINVQTKTKFDNLLRVALNKKLKSTQQLIEDESSFIETLHKDVPEPENDDLCENKNFILNRFLNASVNEGHGSYNSERTKKHPVPLPRISKIKTNSLSSTNTYSIKSTNIFTSVIKANLSSTTKDDSNSSDNSARTYDINKRELVSDVIVHKCPTEDDIKESKSTSINKSQEIIETSRSSKSNLREQGISKENNVSEVTNSSSKRDVASSSKEEIIEMQPISTQMEYENEIKPKVKTRRKIKKEEESNLEKKYKYEKIISITVHKTDRLELNNLIIHPVVKIHIVNGETGEYLQKTDKKRAAVFYLENNDVTYLLPVITRNFNLQTNRSLHPEWEEIININEDFDYLINPLTRAIVFFEILDFVTFSAANLQSTGSSRGWHKIAWAFLKVVGKNDIRNTNKKLRLQLYYPGKANNKGVLPKCDVFNWWSGKKLVQYPSTLYVTVKATSSADAAVDMFRSKIPLQCENNDLNIERITNESCAAVETRSRGILPHFECNTCKLPKKLLTQLDSKEEGCFVLKFSHSGLYLACSVLLNNMYTMLIYSVLEFDNVYKLPSHQGLIYNISWSKDDSLLLSSSADGTVCIWDMKKITFFQMLPHPSYIYWCEIAENNVIVTCCYDSVLRIWIPVSNDKLEYVLHDELESHAGYITCACFNRQSNLIYSSDAVGVIVEWKTNKTGKWQSSKEIKIVELKQAVINQIILHKKETRLIVHTRDSVVRILDIKAECIIHWLEGANNSKVRTLCCITPCFTYILTGDENGIIFVWNIDTGSTVATYHPYANLSSRNLPVHCIDYNPKQNVFAFSHFGHKVPIKIYINDESENGDVDVRIIGDVSNASKNFDSGKSIHGKGKMTTENISNKIEKKINLQHILEKIDKIIG